MMHRKRGFIQDYFVWSTFLLIIAICFIVGIKVFTYLNSDIQANDDISATAKAISNSQIGRLTSIADSMFILTFFGVALGIVMLFYIFQTHPAFFFPVVIVVAFILVIVAIFGNVYDEFSDEDSMSATAAELPAMNWLMDHFVIIASVMFFIGIVVLFAKFGGGS